MKGKKQFRKIRELLCLLLAAVLIFGTVPIEPAFASESETTEGTEELMEAGGTDPGTQTDGEDQEEGSVSESVGEDPGSGYTEPVESTGTESLTDTEPNTNMNRVSGVLWIDANEDGTYDNGEQPLAGYPVYLYLEGDTDNAVQTATTDADGKYRFEDISPGRYVMGIKAEENGRSYLLPLMGVQNGNKFYFAPDYSKVISNPIDIATDTVVEDIDAAMRMMPQIQPMANTTYTIDITTQATVTSSITAQSIPGVSIANNVLTFTNTVDPTDTYILTGTTTTVRVVVATGVTANITLDGASMTHSTRSPFELQGTADVALTLEGTNTLTCTSAVTNTYVPRAGVTVPVGTILTIKSAGTLNATGGAYGAGIGGYGYYASTTVYGGTNAGTITINSGTIIATSGVAGAGIGGGGFSCSGTTTINGGNITAIGNAGAGIGAGSSAGTSGSVGTINIGGGTVTATSSTGGAGIGGGCMMSGVLRCTINISGGTITATGNTYSASGAPGIGGGYGNSATNVIITISGGTVTAKSTLTTVPGIGSYLKTLNVGTVIFTGGSIYPTDSAGTVSVYPTPTNGSANGNDVVGMLTFAQFAGQDFSIVAGGTLNSYTYEGTGHATAGYLWLAYPGIITDPATNVTANSATLNGTYYMNGTAISSAYFEYGTSTSYGSTKTLTTPTNTTLGVIESVSDNLTGLTSNTTYHYRLVITVGSITVPGNDMTFTTKPVVDTLTAAPTGSSTATISGTIAAGSENISDVIITYATDAGFTANVVTLDGSSGVTFTDTTYTANITGLTSGQTYYIKVQAVGLGGTSDAKTTSFLAGGYPVTEKFVGLNGSAVDAAGLPENMVFVTGSYTASGIPTSHTAGGNTYTYIGYKLDSYTTGDLLTSGTPSSVTITGSRDVYYVYAIQVDLTISNTITGAYGDPNKAFEVTITLENSGAPVIGTYSYTGAAISGVTAPANGSITFDAAGQGTISLKHGQTITIKDILQGYTYTVEETDGAVTVGIYTAAYSGTGTVSGPGDSISETLGSTTAAVAITNDRSTVPASGLSGINYQLAVVGILTVLAAALTILWSYRRKRKCQ